jgi:acyl-CoA thioesterase-1
MPLHRSIPVAALLVATAVPAGAQDAAPAGIVDDPCIGAPVVPASVMTYLRSVFDPSGRKVAPPLADLAAFKAAQDKAKASDWPDLCHYRADNARVAALPQAERRVVYIGDSITEAWGIADPAFFTGGRIDRGISGQTTAQMLLRFEADVIALHPAMVHIMAGTNDIAGNAGPETMQDLQNNMVAMVALAKANHIRVVLASVPPAGRFAWRPALRPVPQIRAFNAWLKRYAQETGATFVDYYPLMATPEGAMQPGLTIDGVHPNAAGYAAIKPLSTSATARVR